MKAEIAGKSDSLETEASHCYGEVENCNEGADFEVISV